MLSEGLVDKNDYSSRWSAWRFSSTGLVILALSLVVGCASSPAPQKTVWDDQEEAERPERGDPRVFVPHAQRTIARRMPQFRRCFERMDAAGKISLVLTIDGGGAVSHAEAYGPVPREVTACVESTARRAQFSSPEGGAVARLDVPVAIIRQP